MEPHVGGGACGGGCSLQCLFVSVSLVIVTLFLRVAGLHFGFLHVFAGCFFATAGHPFCPFRRAFFAEDSSLWQM